MPSLVTTGTLTLTVTLMSNDQTLRTVGARKKEFQERK